MCAVLFSLLLTVVFVSTLAAAEIDYIQFTNIELNLFHMLLMGDVMDMGSGLVFDFNTGNLLWHIGARVQYLEGFGLAGEAGVGFIFDATYESNAEFVQIIPISSWTVGNIRYTEYERIEGTCPAAFLHVLEAGLKPHYLATEGYNWESTFSDLIFYGGYRFASFYSEFAPTQEFEVQLHALVGLTGRYEVDYGTETRDDGRVAFGIEAGAKWYILHINIAYYDGFFYMDYAFRLPITIM